MAVPRGAPRERSCTWSLVVLLKSGSPGRWPRMRTGSGRLWPPGDSQAAAEVPPAGLLDARPNRHQPYIFTGQEIAALLAAAGQHRWHLPAVTYPALFGLIASTGLRISEALALDDADADPDEAMITIRVRVGVVER